MTRVVFSSKDPVLQRHYEETFGEEFNKAVVEAEEASRNIPNWGAVFFGDKTYSWREVLVQAFIARMLKEAEVQEHYNYTVNDDGAREIVCVEVNGVYVPQLLIPEIEIR